MRDDVSERRCARTGGVGPRPFSCDVCRRRAGSDTFDDEPVDDGDDEPAAKGTVAEEDKAVEEADETEADETGTDATGTDEAGADEAGAEAAAGVAAGKGAEAVDVPFGLSAGGGAASVVSAAATGTLLLGSSWWMSAARRLRTTVIDGRRSGSAIKSVEIENLHRKCQQAMQKTYTTKRHS